MPDGERAVTRAQPQDRRCYFFRTAHAADGFLVDDLLSSLRRAAGKAVHHWGVDDTGTDGVDPDIRRCVVEGRASRQPDDAVLGGAVRRAPAEALHPGTGGRVNDRTSTGSQEVRNFVFHAEEDAEQVNVDDSSPLLLGDVGDRGGWLFDTGVV